jgi:hypothetical protein
MLDLKLIFPKRDDLRVAKFLRLKAQCLRRAGVIGDAESRAVAADANRLAAASKRQRSHAETRQALLP